MANGLIDTSTLTRLPAQPTLRLTAVAATAWTYLAATVLATYGWVATLTDAYRDYATQERIFRQRYTTTYLSGRPRKWWLGRWWYLKRGYAAAATPGTSNHGLGATVDVASLGGFNGTRYKQFAFLAEAQGWSNAEGRSINEAWHWNYRGGGTPIANPIGGGGGSLPTVDVTRPTPVAPKEWDEMASKQEIKDALTEVLRAEMPTLLKGVSSVQLVEARTAGANTTSGWYVVDRGAYTKKPIGQGQVDHLRDLGLRVVAGQPGSTLDTYTRI